MNSQLTLLVSVNPERSSVQYKMFFKKGFRVFPHSEGVLVLNTLNFEISETLSPN